MWYRRSCDTAFRGYTAGQNAAVLGQHAGYMVSKMRVDHCFRPLYRERATREFLHDSRDRDRGSEIQRLLLRQDCSLKSDTIWRAVQFSAHRPSKWRRPQAGLTLTFTVM